MMSGLVYKPKGYILLFCINGQLLLEEKNNYEHGQGKEKEKIAANFAFVSHNNCELQPSHVFVI